VGHTVFAIAPYVAAGRKEKVLVPAMNHRHRDFQPRNLPTERPGRRRVRARMVPRGGPKSSNWISALQESGTPFAST